MIQNLAQIGATFYPPAHPITETVSQLSRALIQDKQDDKQFHYTFELQPVGGHPDLKTGLLLMGNYVLIRQENRDGTWYRDGSMIPWDRLSLHEESGRVVYKDKPGCIPTSATAAIPNDCLFAEESYFVIEMNTAASSLDNDVQQVLFNALKSDVSAQGPKILKAPIAEENLTKVTAAIANLRSADKVQSAVTTLKSPTATRDSIKAAMEAFLSYWFDKDSKGQYQHQFNQVDQDAIVEGISQHLAQCVSESELVNLMGYIRNRDSTKKSELLSAFSRPKCFKTGQKAT